MSWSSRGVDEMAAPGETGINIVSAYFHQDNVRTPITSAFTSNANVRYLMETLIYAIQKTQGKLIGPQPIQALATIMKYFYKTNEPYAEHLVDIEVEMLNRLVLQHIIHETSQASLAQDRYLKDSYTQPVPPDRPENTNIKGSRQYELNYFL